MARNWPVEEINGLPQMNAAERKIIACGSTGWDCACGPG